MVCCTECFRDYEIKSVIETIGHKGICPICNSKDVYIFDSDLHENDTEFEELLESIIEIYKTEIELDEEFPKEGKQCIEKHLSKDWNIFNVDEQGIRTIIEYIISNSINLDNDLLVGNVGVLQVYDEGYLSTNSIMGKYEWEDFKTYLRSQNRFHSKYINLIELKRILKDTETILTKDLKFYRARISDKNGFKGKEMGAPPPDKATAGRVNSKGISCLYLANKRETAVKEIRASVYDYVTIATFKIKRNIKILDLSALARRSPFYATDKAHFLINHKHLNDIALDISKPLARSDSDLDYLPTQYISDYAKFLGYDGVKYNSTFDRDTYNVAIFDENVCECVYTKRYLIDNAEYVLSSFEKTLLI